MMDVVRDAKYGLRSTSLYDADLGCHLGKVRREIAEKKHLYKKALSK